MNIDELTIGQARELGSLFRSTPGLPTPINHGYAIVVLTRGFVYVARVEEKGSFVYLSDAKNIRVWGTTKGLGELIISGPTEKTRLDPCGDFKSPMTSVISIHPTKEALWLF